MSLFYDDILNEASGENDTYLKMDYEYNSYNERIEAYLIPIAFLLIFVVGVLGNGTLVTIFRKEKSMRCILNTYIMSLVVSDLLIIIFCVPVFSIIYTIESWPWGSAICKLSHTITNLSDGVSAFTLTALCAQRYFVVVNPVSNLQGKPSAIFIWILASIFALPSGIFTNVRGIELYENLTINVCHSFADVTPADINTYVTVDMILEGLIYYIIPFFIISCFYILMAQNSYKSSREMQYIGEQIFNQCEKQQQLDKIVTTLEIVFFMFFLPHHFFKLWFYLNPYSLDEYNDYWHAINVIGFWLRYTHSCVNPIAIYFVSKPFKQHFKKYLFCCNFGMKQNCI